MTITRRIYLALVKDLQPVFAAYQNAGPEAALVAVGFLYSENVGKVIWQVWNESAPPAAEQTWRKMANQKSGSIGKFSKAWLKLVRRFLNENALAAIKDQITETTRKWVAKYIQQNIDEGGSIEDLRAVLEGQFSRVRARRIARTERVKATNYGHLTAAYELPYEVVKIWNSARDKRTRRGDPPGTSDHLDMDLQEQELDVPFVDAGNNAFMMCPGDISLNAPAGSVINCRCRVTFRGKRGADGRLIMR